MEWRRADNLNAMTTTAAPYLRLPSVAFTGNPGLREGPAQMQLESRVLRAVSPLVQDLGAATIVDLLDDFIVEAPARFRELDALAQRPDQDEVFRRTAHSFKGASGIFGLTDLVQLAMELEMSTQGRPVEGSWRSDRVRELRLRFQESLPVLRSVRRQLQSRT